MTDGLRPSSLRKRAAILAAAEQVFLRDGYLGANMDELDRALGGLEADRVRPLRQQGGAVRRAGREHDRAGAGDGVHTDDLPDPTSSPDHLRAALTDYAVRQLTAVMSPRILRLRRLVIGEESRFPELARVLWENGPARAMDALAGHIARLTEQGWLDHGGPAGSGHVPELAGDGGAGQPGDAARGRGVPDRAVIEAHCAEAVRIFLAAFGRGRARPGTIAPPAGEARGAIEGWDSAGRDQ